MRKHVLIGAALLAFAAPVAAQNTVPQVGVTSDFIYKTTYSAVFIGLVPAASATDVVCLAGSATKTIRVQNINISGSGTAISIPVTLLKRTTADSGGTAASTTANPANTISKRDSNYPTATAVPIAYTANPTINDTSPTYIDSQQLGVAATTVGIINSTVRFEFGNDDANLLAPPVLRGTGQQVCLNFNATSPTALLNGSITWTEE